MLSSAHSNGTQAKKISTVKLDVGQAAHNSKLPKIVASKNLKRNIIDWVADKKLTGNSLCKNNSFYTRKRDVKN